MAKLAVGLLFDRKDKSKVLMYLHWNCRFYGAFRGITVEVEEGVDPTPALSKRIKEVTGCTVYNAPAISGHTEGDVSYYVVNVNDDEVEQQGASGILAWIPVRTLYTNPEYFSLLGITKGILDAAVSLASTAFS